jgi:hypothetical protein
VRLAVIVPMTAAAIPPLASVAATCDAVRAWAVVAHSGIVMTVPEPHATLMLPVAHRDDPTWGAAGLPQLPNHLLDVLVSIARTGGQVHRHALHHQSLAGLLDCQLVANDDHDLVELTPLGLRVLAGVGLERIRQQAAARRGRVSTDPRGRVRWAG